MALWYSRLSDWLVRHQTRIKQMGLGMALYGTFNVLYDHAFYLFALGHWGFVKGGLIAAGGSYLCCSVLFWLYDHMKIDWLGAYVLRELELKENKTRLQKVAVWIGKEKKTTKEKILSPMLFLFLSTQVDPLIVAVHYKRRHFDGLTWRDWGVLLASITCANAWWLLRSGLIVQLFFSVKEAVL